MERFVRGKLGLLQSETQRLRTQIPRRSHCPQCPTGSSSGLSCHATLIRSRYDDGGYSGGSTDRPDLQRLVDDIRARKLDVIVVYKVDRLTRSLADFAKLVELFDAQGVSFVSVTQQFNTTTS